MVSSINFFHEIFLPDKFQNRNDEITTARSSDYLKDVARLVISINLRNNRDKFEDFSLVKFTPCGSFLNGKRFNL